VPQRASKGRVELKPAQERVLAVLAEDGSGRLTRGRYEEIAGVSRSQAAYDLAELVDAGILERVGGGRATTYRLVRRVRSAGQRHWTNERIRAGLVDFCAERKTWPSASEFKADGRSDLYVAASRYGGIGFWATELGFVKPSRPTAQQGVTRSWRPRLRWAKGGAAIAAALSAAAAGTVVVRGDIPAHDTVGRQSASGSAPVRQSIPARPELKVRTRTATAKTKAAPARQIRRHARASSPSTPSQGAQSGDQAELVVARVSTPTYSSASASRQEEVAQRGMSSGSSGPAPLPPPSGGGTPPAPLPPPQR
jgi:hypothetical protein